MNGQHWFKSRVHDLDREECLELLESLKVGRIVFVDDSGPDALPVNYVMDGSDVLVATTPYGAIARGATNERVAFEVDEIFGYSESGWSVVVRGRATRESPFDPPPELPYPWAEGNRSYVLRIRADQITGRRLIPS